MISNHRAPHEPSASLHLGERQADNYLPMVPMGERGSCRAGVAMVRQGHLPPGIAIRFKLDPVTEEAHGIPWASLDSSRVNVDALVIVYSIDGPW
jgi:hypothetical protein